jgi:hypothetical protein
MDKKKKFSLKWPGLAYFLDPKTPLGKTALVFVYIILACLAIVLMVKTDARPSGGAVFPRIHF